MNKLLPPGGRVVVRNARVGGGVHVEGPSVEITNVHADGDIVAIATDDVSVSTLPLPSEASRIRRLYRDSYEGYLGGVCAGLAARMRVDPLWLRVLFVATAWFWFSGIVLYVVAWRLLPDRPGTARPPAPPLVDEVPPELREAWREVNEITKN